MKKFFRILASGYIVFILFLLIEVLLILLFQFKMDDIVANIFGLDKASDQVVLIVVFVYITFRVIGYVMAFIIFYMYICYLHYHENLI